MGYAVIPSRGLVPLLAVLLLPGLGHAADSAETLVDLVRPHTRDLQAAVMLIRFNPFGPAPNGPDCMRRRLDRPQLRDAYVRLYRQRLSPADRDAAIAFYGSEQGRALVAFRERRDAMLPDLAFEALKSGKQVDNSLVEYPEALQASLDGFHGTPVGRHYEDDRIDRELPEREQFKQAQSDALVACLREGSPQPGSPAGR
jgi:hypothetical protein